MLPQGWLCVGQPRRAKIDTLRLAQLLFQLEGGPQEDQRVRHPYTPAHTLIFALRTALRRIKEEGLENVWQARHRKMSEACQAGIQRQLELFSARPAEGLTAFRVPDGLKESQIRNKLTERFGITTVGGQEKLKGTIIRIGHMGYTDELDVISTLAALEMTLAELGYDVEPGRAIGSAAGAYRPESCHRLIPHVSPRQIQGSGFQKSAKTGKSPIGHLESGIRV